MCKVQVEDIASNVSPTILQNHKWWKFETKQFWPIELGNQQLTKEGSLFCFVMLKFPNLLLIPSESPWWVGVCQGGFIVIRHMV